MPGPSTLTLIKLHGLGNDFLVVFTDTVAAEVDLAGTAVRVCDRHRGVGADGLLVATPTPADPRAWTMRLYNADGSIGAMSGNGIRCFAHAVLRRQGVAMRQTLQIATDAGPRVVHVEPDPDHPDRVQAQVDMGVAEPGPTIPDGALPAARTVHRRTTVDVGNPHLILLVDDPDDVDLATEGPAWEALVPGGINVHFVAVPDRANLRLAVWERGAGITEACGTGAAAAAVAAKHWELVDDAVTVAMPGGSVAVSLGDRLTLTGPSEWIADVEVRA